MGQKITVSAVIPSEGKYLFVLNARDKKWSLPAGKVKPRESTERALHRELQEEINARVSIHTLIGVYRFISDRGNDITNFVYYATLRNGIPHGGEGIVQLRYCTREEIEEYDRLGRMRALKANIQPIEDYERGLQFP